MAQIIDLNEYRKQKKIRELEGLMKEAEDEIKELDALFNELVEQGTI